jgi:alcohol dehydrogenase class IV
VQQPQNIDARTGMALAATLAGLSFSNAAVALVHAMEYPLGGAVHCSHGAGNGLLLPYVMRYLLPARLEEYARIGELLGADTAGVTRQAAAERAIETVERLCEAIGIPRRIRELGGREDQLPVFAEKAFAIKRLMALTPRPVTAADILTIYQSAY